MIQTTSYPHISIRNGKSCFSFLPEGDCLEWIHDGVRINTFCGNHFDGATGNIYLRIYQNGQITAYPLIGLRSGSTLHIHNGNMVQEGRIGRIFYRITFRLTDNGVWFWDISLDGQGDTADLIYTQDIAVGAKESVLSNELYLSQYLGHTVLEGPYGYVIASRQNMCQNGKNPYLQQGTIGIRCTAYATDGMQFFGTGYKKTGIPQALTQNLPSQNRQFELAQISLQTETIALDGPRQFSFYGICLPDHPHAISSLEYQDELMQAFSSESRAIVAESPSPASSSDTAFRPGAPYASREWTPQEIAACFPDRILEEKQGDELLSFFTPDHAHVVLQKKELLVERPHGHILISDFDLEHVPHGIVSSTNYMYGVFHAQAVVGNTNLNKLLSNHRGLLNTERISGMRIFVQMDGAYRQLTLPAAYCMSASESVWYYQIEDDVLTVRSFVMYGRPELVLQVSSSKNRPYHFIVTNQLAARTDECGYDMNISTARSALEFTPIDRKTKKPCSPAFRFRMRIPEHSAVCESDPSEPSLLTIKIDGHAHFDLVIQGYENADNVPFLKVYDAKEQRSAYQNYYRSLTAGFRLSAPDGTDVSCDTARLFQKLNAVVYWFSHDALVHFASPHGLEQSGGAAWGTRDICQGPVEFFLTTGHTKLVRNILLVLFSHQLAETSEWPQWFMFDSYPIHQADCHGDIVFWPLKAVSDYILATGDTSILAEQADYRHEENALPSGSPEPLLAHIRRAVHTIKQRYLPGSALISYAGGDWDDTLQPANKSLRENLVSAWTQALAAQTMGLLSRALKGCDDALSEETAEMSRDIADAFHKYLIKDGVIAGFLYRESETHMRPMLHPEDAQSPIHYRLLPLTRSIISRLASPELAKDNFRLIDEHLACPDGVRLMDHPASYAGGISTTFLRAEQAANIGREISLQYVHAHIRYIEAAATAGQAKRAWDALLRVNPILLPEYVPNANTRQSNVYFSSSDGCFPDRYQYAAEFSRLRTGDIPVNGGWRLYSSGPGIYIRRLIADLLGIRPEHDAIVLDPVVPSALNGAEVTLLCFGRPVHFIYHTDSALPLTAKVSGKTLPCTALDNPYRKGGIRIIEKDFLAAIRENPEVHLYM